MIKKSAGASVKYYFSVKNASKNKVDITNHALDIKVIKLPEKTLVMQTPIASRTEDNLNFVVEISGAETAAFGEGKFKICHKISLDAEGFIDKKDIVLLLTESCF